MFRLISAGGLERALAACSTIRCRDVVSGGRNLLAVCGLAIAMQVRADLPAYPLEPFEIPAFSGARPTGSPYFRLAPEAAGGSVPDDADASAFAYPWRHTPPSEPDWKGVGRDTAYFLGYQFVVIGLLYISPESISSWSDEDKKKYSFQTWRDNISPPVWDEDKWYINYLLHPYWGGAYYIRGRERGLDGWQAFGYSAFMSALYEYGAEALFEKVSIQDLIFTPLLGSLLGEFVFAPLREHIRSKPGTLDWGDKLLLGLTDPLGIATYETDRLFGVKPTYSLTPVAMLGPRLAGDAQSATSGIRNYANDFKPVLGMQFRMNW
jgi:hypothetical protein